MLYKFGKTTPTAKGLILEMFFLHLVGSTVPPILVHLVYNMHVLTLPVSLYVINDIHGRPILKFTRDFFSLFIAFVHLGLGPSATQKRNYKGLMHTEYSSYYRIHLIAQTYV